MEKLKFISILILLALLTLLKPQNIYSQAKNIPTNVNGLIIIYEKSISPSSLLKVQKNIFVMSTEYQKSIYDKLVQNTNIEVENRTTSNKIDNKIDQSKPTLQQAKKSFNATNFQALLQNQIDTYESVINKYNLDFQEASNLENIDLNFEEYALKEPLSVTDLRQLNQVFGVLKVQQNFLYQTNIVPDDPDYSSQWHLKKNDFEKIWEKYRGSKSVKIAVIDDGFVDSHPDLGSNFLQVIDVCASKGQSSGHGMNVAGIIGALGNNGINVAGINWQVGLYGINVNCKGLNGSEISSSSLLKAFDKVLENQIRVVNLSLGGQDTGDDILKTALKKMVDSGVVVVVSAGNCGRTPSQNGCSEYINGQPTGKIISISTDNLYPANDPNVITVGALDSGDNLASFSSTGNSLDITASGVDILSTGISGNYKQSGTSQASPQVAGLVALLMSINPSPSSQAIRQVILDTATKIGDQDPTKFGSGKLNPLKAVLDSRIGGNLDSESTLAPPSSSPTISQNNPTNPPVTSIIRDEQAYLDKIVSKAKCENTDLYSSIEFVCQNKKAGTVLPVDSSCANIDDMTREAKNACRVAIDGSTSITFRTRLQGVSSPRLQEITTKVGVKGGEMEDPIFKSIAMKHITNGVFEGTVNFNTVPGDDYTFYIKGPVHMQRKFCENNPKEIQKGVYSCEKGNLTLKDGENTFDFTNVPILVGDLPDSTGVQDGILNARDISQLRQSIDLGNNEISLDFCDVNFDGACNTIDWSLLISALSARGDER